MTSIAQQIGNLAEARALDGQRRDFAQLVKYLALGRPGAAEAAHLAARDRAGERVVDAIKAQVDPMAIAGAGAPLSPFQLLANAFMNSLAVFGAFDRMLGSMMQLPLRSRIISTTATITGVSLQESDIKRFGSLSLTASDLVISKVAAVLAISREVLLTGGDGALQYLERELRQSVAVASDTLFLNLITAGAASFPSSGASANGMRIDLRSMVQTIGLGAASRLFLITTPDNAAAWAIIGDTSGGPAFPGALYNGGNAAGIPIISTDGCPANTIILADASGIAANSEGLRVDSTEVASLQMDSSPDSPPIAGTSYVNLWQQQMVAVKVERFFGAKVCRANSVAMITGTNYTGSSP